MRPDSEVERAAVVEAARAWLRTPYHHMAAVPGVGIDCAMLVLRAYQAAGIVPAEIDPRPYPVEWHLHRSEEQYLGWIERYARSVDGPPRPGDIAIWRFGRCYSHAGIVTEWPCVVHSYLRLPVDESDASRGELFFERGGDPRPRPVKFFSPWDVA